MDFSQAITHIENAKHIGLVLPQNPNHDVMACAEVLVRFLSARRIYTGLIAPADLPSLVRGSAWQALLSLKPLVREFIVSLNTREVPITQLRYENTPNHINIILSPSVHAAAQHHISFQEGNAQCDCIVTIGVDDKPAAALSTSPTDSPLSSDIPVIALAVSKTHKQYGAINFVDPSLTSVAELMYQFLASFPDHTFASEGATLLLSGILDRTDAFSRGVNAAALLAGHELIRLGADFEAAYSLSRAHIPRTLVPLLGRALARSRLDTTRSIAWSILTADDFIATRSTARDATYVLDRIKKEFSEMRMSVLLWQDPAAQRIHASLAAPQSFMETIRLRTNAEFNSPHLLLADTYDAFADAETSVSALIDTVL